ncbi:MAG: N-acetylmuramoyl-L-alanine amidase [Anaerolineae bacterium]|nr:N-acetylmuramoyl-L-alanine amidase [Anaerolineae bacterium]
MWLPNCLPATYPAHTCTYSARYGVPPFRRGRCQGVPLAGAVIHCIDEPAQTFLQSRLTVPRHFNGVRRHHDSLHWLIDAEGNLIQMVHEQDVAWGWGDPTAGNCVPSVPWQPLSGVSPSDYDCAVIHIGVEVPQRTGLWGGCGCDCRNPTPYAAVNPTLVRLIAAIAQRYGWAIDADHFALDDDLSPCGDECECFEIGNILCAARAYCERPILFSQEDYPEVPASEQVEWILVITDTGRLARVRRSVLIP